MLKISPILIDKNSSVFYMGKYKRQSKKKTIVFVSLLYPTKWSLVKFLVNIIEFGS